MEAKKVGNAPESTQIPALPPLKSKEEAAAAVKAYAHLQADLAIFVAERNKAVVAVQEKHQPHIDNVFNQAARLKAQLEAWALKNPKAFADARSIEFSHGFLKFRTGARKIVLLARWTEKKVLEKLLSFPVTSQWREYIRYTPAIDKAKLLLQTKDGGKLPEAKLREIGLRVDQEDNFEVQPKPDAVAADCDVMP